MSSAAAAHGGLASLYAAMRPPAPPAVPVIDVTAIADDAYRSGFAAGLAHAETALEPERLVLKAASSALIVASVVDVDAVRGVFLTLVKALAAAVIGGELRTDSEVMSRLVDGALASVATRDGIVVRVHPDDVPSLRLDLAVVADPGLYRGMVEIDGPSFVVCDSLDARLAGIMAGVA
jgi:flagellar biosynthesis/type III secretory pathway protein FliH